MRVRVRVGVKAPERVTAVPPREGPVGGLMAAMVGGA